MSGEANNTFNTNRDRVVELNAFSISSAMLKLVVAVLCVSTAHGECEEGKWAECRQELVKAIFNSSKVPGRKPDYILVRCLSFL